MNGICKIIVVGVFCMLLLSSCGKKENTDDIVATKAMLKEAVKIELSDETILVDGEKIAENTDASVYVANDIIYYEAGKDFTYGEGSAEDEHSKEEADKHNVVHITEPGSYSLSGELSFGQIAIDLGEEAKKDENAVVNLILNGATIRCDVAPAVIFYNVYECSDDDTENASKDVDTSKAGANVYIADDTENNVTGSYVARIYESVVLNEEGTEVVDSKKLHKYDAAFYSKCTMNVNGGEKGNGILNIKAENEGLDSELHLTVNGGKIYIESGNDGINTNEDEVSVTTINGGTLNILVNGSTGEGDGIDSNGWLVINGGTVIAQACSDSGDAGVDSDMGIHLNGGTVIATGNMFDQISQGNATYVVFSFDDRQTGENTYVLKNEENETVMEFTNVNNFTFLSVLDDKLTEGDYTLWCNNSPCEGTAFVGGGFGGGFGGGERPEGMEMPKMGERPEGMEMPKMGERPEGMEMPKMDRKPGNMTEDGESSTTFPIKKGENKFMNVRILDNE